MPWRAAMDEALYGPGGFFLRARPADHFRTSAIASPLFAEAILALLERLDAALGSPDPLDVHDVGAGRGELLEALFLAAPPSLERRLRGTAVERALTPDVPPAMIRWASEASSGLTGLLIATEWLDNIPLDVAQVDDAGTARLMLVDPATGAEEPGPPVAGSDAAWLATWWPSAGPGSRAEIGASRDQAWAGVCSAVDRGLALAVDYGHVREHRPWQGTLTGFRAGRELPPVPDGSMDITAHVAFDALGGGVLADQQTALRALGVDGTRPPLADASTDPAGYVRALAAASQAAELTDPAGLGGHLWLARPVEVDPAVLPWRATIRA